VTKHLLALAVLIAALAAPRPAAAQDALDGARTLYAAARYDEALALLDGLRLSAAPGPDQALGVEKYRALCLLALGREEEADSAFAGVVVADPTYLPDTSEVSPSVRAFFRGVRRRMLPGIVRAKYAEAKAAYDRRDYPEAAARFDVLAMLLADDDMEPGHEDLRDLADGFAELSHEKARATGPAMGASAPSPATAAVAAAASRPAFSPPAEPAPERPIYGPDAPGVTPPVAVREDVPPPPPDARLMGRARALLEVVIDERGFVTSAVVRESMYSEYDRLLVAAAGDWRYEPASLDGAPVKYRKVVEVTVR